jgi:large subunit ribosomal protein L29
MFARRGFDNGNKKGFEMKAEQYRDVSVEELVDRQDELKQKLFEMRSQSVTETLENSKSIRDTRREIARILTVIREKQK